MRPGVLLLKARRRRLQIRFNAEDLPAFERPAIVARLVASLRAFYPTLREVDDGIVTQAVREEGSLLFIDEANRMPTRSFSWTAFGMA